MKEPQTLMEAIRYYGMPTWRLKRRRNSLSERRALPDLRPRGRALHRDPPHVGVQGQAPAQAVLREGRHHHGRQRAWPRYLVRRYLDHRQRQKRNQLIRVRQNRRDHAKICVARAAPRSPCHEGRGRRRQAGRHGRTTRRSSAARPKTCTRPSGARTEAAWQSCARKGRRGWRS